MAIGVIAKRDGAFTYVPPRFSAQTVRVYGPPGTGKTYWLTKKADELFSQGLHPSRLGVVAFSRDAADNARQRLADATGLDPDVLCSVRGIHQVALEQWRGKRPHSKKADDPKDKVLEAFFSEIGVEWSRWADLAEDSDTDEWVAPGNYALACWDWMRSTGQPWDTDRLVEFADAFPMGLPDGFDAWSAAELLGRVIPAYEEWKQDLQRWDFTDLLEDALRTAVAGGTRPAVDALFVDESQDMGKLLWSVCDAWAAGVRFVAYAGDPNQALYAFIGAHPALFEDHRGTAVRLEQSYRVTQAAVELAKQVLSDGGADAAFPWLGLVDAPVKGDGTLAYLARTNRLIEAKARELMSEGTPFLRSIRTPNSIKNPLGRKEARHLAALLRLGGKEHTITAEDLAGVVDPRWGYVPAGGAADGRWMERSTASKVARLAKATPAAPLSTLDLESLGFTRAFITAIARQAPWPIVGAMNDRLLSYYRAIVENHGVAGLTDTPKLTLSTIHRAKGQEWDDVELCLDWGRKPYASLNGDDEEARAAEYRVLYVALTRSRRFPTFCGEDASTAVEL